ncbi:OVARIAN TUMOR DOMAIN-containing deubiquitinating enzyme 2 isoform X2 [Folsomia candida]|nr:OVARIAN TUMOR DOMAIN-containing deubiquitinating enzyme 2 isoform X2 [Folsomia candida]XP_021954123.1 OVARIAN TUMOR DOMAIN-containing deubiquitinating enzyme 2 isoform X2 [Folsomia candida]XP_021954124.1 OVARIAN TUMOR DOMAIN-containing deubiquitinating enzyme 2 isoform X2 [Folsomia candida]XP_021954125.1 OVARIAN TUMOR DOMAIN-containing deubiquitinating enzyme 2 isoform X2 [Folsomia candida]XP_035708614.1 OVARIAN TUMOR DOMAIN-containing deubiquitinating enzyme 2 isoform X2 [Folsomia candida]
MSTTEGVELAEKWLALRIKSKKSQSTILRDVSTKQTVHEFIVKLAEMTDVPEDKMMILTGFPPKKIELDRLALLESLGLSNQDTVIVELDVNSSAAPAAGTSLLQSQAGKVDQTPPTNGPSEAPVRNQLIINALNASTVKELETQKVPTVDIDSPELSRALTSSTPSAPSYQRQNLSSEGMLLRQIVPADNSCLFTSISFCLTGGANEHEDPGATHTRELIAATVASDADRFDEAMLGRPNADYVQWIMKSESWGGGIELSILSEFYEFEMAVVDIQSLHICKFGEDKNYSERLLLLYDGIHYDPLYFDPFDGSKIQTKFPTSDSSILDKAIQLGREAKAAHQFTDLSNFSLKCGVCYQLLKGQTEAQAHAKQTGHTNFSEITQ